MKYIFDDVLEIKNGRNQKAVENPEGKYPIYGSGGLMGYADDYICSADTVIIGRKGSINNPIFVKEPFWNVDTAFGLVAKRELLHPKYLFYFCKKFNFEKTKSDLLKINIEVPEMSDQEDVINRLEKIEQIIELRQEELIRLDELIKARFVELFGDPVLNPLGWKVKPVIDICDCMVPGRDKPKAFTGDIPWITIDDLVVNGTTFKSKKGLGLTEEEISEVKRKAIPVGSVVMSCVGNLGICSIAGNEMIINQQLHSFQCHPEINNIFLMYYLGYRKDYMEKQASSTTVLYMNKSICNSIPVIIPDLVLQEQFVNYCF